MNAYLWDDFEYDFYVVVASDVEDARKQVLSMIDSEIASLKVKLLEVDSYYVSCVKFEIEDYEREKKAIIEVPPRELPPNQAVKIRHTNE